MLNSVKWVLWSRINALDSPGLDILHILHVVLTSLHSYIFIYNCNYSLLSDNKTFDLVELRYVKLITPNANSDIYVSIFINALG